MRAVITVAGKDRTGIIAQVTAFLAEREINVVDISQTIMDEHFAMIMLVDLSKATVQLAALVGQCEELGAKIGMNIHVQHEEIFNAMHGV